WVGGRTVYPIHVAVKHGDTRLVRLLLAERADPRQADSSGCTAMEIAEASNVQGRNDELLMLLKSHTT
ncbi:unnamed protein product, partial [Effrenium voratum]